MVHIYQLRKKSPSALAASALHSQVSTCMQALQQVSKTWLVATMVHKLFANILGWCIPGTRAQEIIETPPFDIIVGDFRCANGRGVGFVE